MNEVIYLESDDEITRVIERVREATTRGVVLVLPRGASLAQSMINLKLLKKSAEANDKVVLFVTKDQVTENLAAQIGLHVFSDVKKAKAHVLSEKEMKAEDDGISDDTNGSGIKINRYAKYSLATREDDSGKAEEGEADREPDEDADASDREQSPEADDSEIGRESVESEAGDDEVEIEQEHEVADNLPPRKSVNTKMIKTSGSRKPFFIVSGLLLLVLLVLAFVFGPSATVRLVLATEESQSQAEISVNRSAIKTDPTKMVLPGELLAEEKELVKKIDSTGKKDVGEKARGNITAYNSWDMNTISLAKGSKFVSKGKSFISTEAVTVPGASIALVAGSTKVTPGSIEVPVEAELPGDAYNIGPSEFVITSVSAEKQGAVVGRTSIAMSGGSTKEVKIVTEEDIKNAKETASIEIKKELEASLGEKAGKSGLVTLSQCNSFEEITSEAAKKAGEEAESFDYSVKGRFFSMGYKKEDLTSLLKQVAEGSLGSNQMLVSFDSENTKLEEKECDIDGGISKLGGGFTFQIGPKYSSDDVAKRVVNKSLSGGGQSLTSLQGVSDALISSWPAFYKRTPVLSNRIKVEFDYRK
ncbi:MAG TPA: hypothetical protein PK263_01100 [bacterium]|nr:hypothetical protein [bacterium]